MRCEALRRHKNEFLMLLLFIFRWSGTEAGLKYCIDTESDLKFCKPLHQLDLTTGVLEISRTGASTISYIRIYEATFSRYLWRDPFQIHSYQRAVNSTSMSSTKWSHFQSDTPSSAATSNPISSYYQYISWMKKWYRSSFSRHSVG